VPLRFATYDLTGPASGDCSGDVVDVERVVDVDVDVDVDVEWVVDVDVDVDVASLVAWLALEEQLVRKIASTMTVASTLPSAIGNFVTTVAASAPS
jgi:hypothetical protein